MADINEKDINPSEEEAKTADEIDGRSFADSFEKGGDYYEKKYEESYSKYNFGDDRVHDTTNEYNHNMSYADMSNNEPQEWHGTRTGGWTSFFRSFPYPMLCIVVYLIVGFVAKAWHPAWIIFLSVPAYYSIVENYATTGKIHFPLFSIVVIAYLLMGFLGNLWHPGWVIFLTWPLYFIFGTLMRIKQTRLLIYTLLCAAIYIVLGLALDLWHPTWIIFLTIPIIESIYVSSKKLIEEKRQEHKSQCEKKK